MIIVTLKNKPTKAIVKQIIRGEKKKKVLNCTLEAWFWTLKCPCNKSRTWASFWPNPSPRAVLSTARRTRAPGRGPSPRGCCWNTRLSGSPRSRSSQRQWATPQTARTCSWQGTSRRASPTAIRPISSRKPTSVSTGKRKGMRCSAGTLSPVRCQPKTCGKFQVLWEYRES